MASANFNAWVSAFLILNSDSDLLVALIGI
jgi:hypothetical protein